MGGGKDGRWDVRAPFFPRCVWLTCFYEENLKQIVTVTPAIFWIYLGPHIFITNRPIIKKKRVGSTVLTISLDDTVCTKIALMRCINLTIFKGISALMFWATWLISVWKKSNELLYRSIESFFFKFPIFKKTYGLR